jgi:hypothetical protein
MTDSGTPLEQVCEKSGVFDAFQVIIHPDDTLSSSVRWEEMSFILWGVPWLDK